MIIFIGGIHGVGKGTVCKNLSELIQLDHYTASQVLKWEEFSPDVKNKKVESIASTQEKLILGLNEIKKKKKSFILDGHFCLFNKYGNPERVPLETFIAISPAMIGLVTEAPSIICRRMEDRDGRSYEVSKLQNMQNDEIKYAKEVSEFLSVPYIEILNSDLSNLITSINEYK